MICGDKPILATFTDEQVLFDSRYFSLSSVIASRPYSTIASSAGHCVAIPTYILLLVLVNQCA